MAFAVREVGHAAEVVFHSLSGEYFIVIGEERIVYQLFLDAISLNY